MLGQTRSVCIVLNTANLDPTSARADTDTDTDAVMCEPILKVRFTGVLKGKISHEASLSGSSVLNTIGNPTEAQVHELRLDTFAELAAAVRSSVSYNVSARVSKIIECGVVE